jgi:hypothetical protein
MNDAVDRCGATSVWYSSSGDVVEVVSEGR